jgi:hypothetical protein
MQVEAEVLVEPEMYSPIFGEDALRPEDLGAKQRV